MWFTDSFSHSVGCLYTPLTVFWCTKIFLMKSNLPIFPSIACTFDIKKSLPNLMSWSFSLMFSSKRFIVLAYMFQSLIHFDPFFCMWISSFPSTICWKDCPFLIENLGTTVKNQLTIYMRVYNWALSPIPLVHMSVFMPVPHCFDYCSFVVSFDIRKCESYNFVLLFQDCFGYLAFEISYEF